LNKIILTLPEIPIGKRLIQHIITILHAQQPKLAPILGNQCDGAASEEEEEEYFCQSRCFKCTKLDEASATESHRSGAVVIAVAVAEPRPSGEAARIRRLQRCGG
jgi:hypothetical protein